MACAFVAGTMKILALLVPFLFATACISDDEPLAETESELSAFDWGATTYVGNTHRSPQVATINGVTYMVHTSATGNALYWRKRTGANTWSASQLISGHSTTAQPSLAAFNGYLYMLSDGGVDPHEVWYSRFDPTTETWTPEARLSLTTGVGAPALAVFDGRLWIVGSSGFDENYDMIWVSTMNAKEEFTTQTSLRGKLTQTPVSIAAFSNKLYVAYVYGGMVYTMMHAAGAAPTTWSGSTTVNAGVFGSAIKGEPRIAVAGGYLHLVYRAGSQSMTWWTYWNQCKWSAAVQFDQTASEDHMALTNGGPGLVLARILQFNGVGSIFVTEYAAPPAPITVPQCLGAVGT